MPGGLDPARCAGSAAPWPVPHSRPRGYAVCCNVFIANGQILAYDESGRPIGQIVVPERPLQILFGDADKRTLFILTHHALYAVNQLEMNQ
jgi:sugar lactone lactonase YvrE